MSAPLHLFRHLLFEHSCPVTMTTTMFFIGDVLLGAFQDPDALAFYITKDVESVYHLNKQLLVVICTCV